MQGVGNDTHKGESGFLKEIGHLGVSLNTQFSGGDFSKSNVSKSHLEINLDHGTASCRKLTQTLADNIDKLLLVWDHLGGLFDILGFHGKDGMGNFLDQGIVGFLIIIQEGRDDKPFKGNERGKKWLQR